LVLFLYEKQFLFFQKIFFLSQKMKEFRFLIYSPNIAVKLINYVDFNQF
jgi:hypothetical protein